MTRADLQHEPYLFLWILVHIKSISLSNLNNKARAFSLLIPIPFCYAIFLLMRNVLNSLEHDLCSYKPQKPT